MPSDVAIDRFMDVLTSAMLRVLTRIGIEVLADESANDFAVFTTALEVPVTTPMEDFGRWAPFDSRPMDALDCNHILQTWMPSYHV